MQIDCIDGGNICGIKYKKMENKKITVALVCATCGGADFDFNEDKTYVRCETCNREYLGGYDELVEFNQAKIDTAMEQTKEQVAEEVKEAVTKSLKDVFRGSKFIKFK